MRSSFRLFKVLGISIEVHITFILFLLLVLIAGPATFVFFFIIFSIILAHELCHSIAAILSGIPVPRIILLPFGGLASIELPENPLTELKISLSGPFFNFFLAGISLALIKLLSLHLFGYGQLLDMLVEGNTGIFTASYVLSMLAMVNLLLGLFNMLPAFPMDGGRVFRSILALWIDYAKATQIAGRIGQMVFLLLVLAGILTFNIWWIIVGLFLMYASGGEVKFVLLKKTFQGLLMRDIISEQRKLPIVEGSVFVKDFMTMFAKPDQRFYLIANQDGTLKGILDLNEVSQASMQEKLKTVGSLAKEDYETVEGSVSVEEGMKKILSNDITLIADGDVVLGYMTPELFFEMTQFYSLKNKPENKTLSIS
ncbi:MAG: hypothetical protein FJY77_02840 [Candidatus Altiarchaeales archaeon]|nr:hypothetical protein [Candidatus Altiarchaeales archaeon]